MSLQIGQIVPISLDMLEINPTVDLAGHSEQLKLSMTEDVLLDNLKLTDNYFPPQIPAHVVVSSLVYHKDVMEVKSEPHGHGSKMMV